MKKCLMIIPAYNEEKNILNVINEIKKIKLNNIKLDYIVINDGSKDNTRKVCIDNKLSFLDLPANLGIGGAVQAGYKYAYYNEYDYAIQFDGDGQHDANYIETLLEEYTNENIDMVIGSRFVKQLSKFRTSFMRRVGINILSFFIKMTTGKKIYDVTSGFRSVNKDIIEEFAKKYPSDYPEPDSIVSILKKGYNVKEVAVEMNEREHGNSSIVGIKPLYYMIKVSLSIIITSIIEDK